MRNILLFFSLHVTFHFSELRSLYWNAFPSHEVMHVPCCCYPRHACWGAHVLVASW